MKLQLVGKKSPALKTVCDDVPRGDCVKTIVKGMFEVMRQKNGVGLAAPQVGITTRLIIIEYGSTSLALLNPVIIKTPGKIVTSIDEGCLSYPSKKVNRKRHKRVIVIGFDTDWNPVKLDARGFLAFIVQHEIDHLNGITIDMEDPNL